MMIHMVNFRASKTLDTLPIIIMTITLIVWCRKYL